MTYSILLVLTLATMLTLGIAYMNTENRTRGKVLQGVAILLAIIAFYCHTKAQLNGEYHRISLVVADYIVRAVQYYGSTSIGGHLLNIVHFLQANDWAIYLLSFLIFVLIYILPSIFRRR